MGGGQERKEGPGYFILLLGKAVSFYKRDFSYVEK